MRLARLTVNAAFMTVACLNVGRACCCSQSLADRQARLETIFRAIDDSGDGTITEEGCKGKANAVRCGCRRLPITFGCFFDPCGLLVAACFFCHAFLTAFWFVAVSFSYRSLSFSLPLSLSLAHSLALSLSLSFPRLFLFLLSFSFSLLLLLLLFRFLFLIFLFLLLLFLRLLLRLFRFACPSICLSVYLPRSLPS